MQQRHLNLIWKICQSQIRSLCGIIFLMLSPLLQAFPAPIALTCKVCWNRRIFRGNSMSFHGFLCDSMPTPLVGSRRFLLYNHTGLFFGCFQKILSFCHVYNEPESPQSFQNWHTFTLCANMVLVASLRCSVLSEATITDSTTSTYFIDLVHSATERIWSPYKPFRPQRLSCGAWLRRHAGTGGMVRPLKVWVESTDMAWSQGWRHPVVSNWLTNGGHIKG